jgi:hypothetical protein
MNQGGEFLKFRRKKIRRIRRVRGGKVHRRKGSFILSEINDYVKQTWFSDA